MFWFIAPAKEQYFKSKNLAFESVHLLLFRGPKLNIKPQKHFYNNQTNPFMQYCELHCDMYPENVVKCDLFDDFEQLTAHIGGQERKSSVASSSLYNSSWLLDFEQEKPTCPIFGPNTAPAEGLQQPCEAVEDIAEDRQNKNETKNIPKNYGKAILGYIQKNKARCNKLLARIDVDCDRFYDFLQSQSRNINSIADLRWLWSDNEFSSPIRMLSYEFMRKHSLPYIFRSRIKNHLTHIKYREKFMDGLRKPDNFRNIKDY